MSNSKERNYERFVAMQVHVANQLESIAVFGNSMQGSDKTNDACNLLGEALEKLDDVSDLITEAYGL